MAVDPRINRFLSSIGKHYSISVQGDALLIQKRDVGDYWLDNDGKWRGMSSEGETGPWDNRRAAEHAANDDFKAAAAANLKGSDT